MTPSQIEIIRNTWSKVVPIGDEAARLFYERLFEFNPEIKPLFDGSDMAAQRGKLLGALALAVQHAADMQKVAPALEDLGRRHVAYGVEDQHYEAVGAALLWTLSAGLGDDFTPETHDAWAALYGEVATPMRRSAHELSCKAA